MKMLVYDKRDGDILFLIRVAVLNTDLRLLNFSSKDHNLEEIVNEKRSGSWDNRPIYFSSHSSLHNIPVTTTEIASLEK